LYRYTTARLMRALLWAATHKKDDDKVHEEFVAYLRVAHPDHRDRFAACAWLSTAIATPSSARIRTPRGTGRSRGVRRPDAITCTALSKGRNPPS
jgi:hypothetical protein